MQVLESSIERTCTDIAKEHRCLLVKIKAVRGFPDRMLLTPFGRITFMEFKRPKEDLGPLQAYIQEELTRLGFISLRIDSVLTFRSYLLASLTLSGSPTGTKSGGLNG